MFKKKLIPFLALLLTLLPLFGAMAGEADAASSRVAVIKELKGTVKVKKNGGSKEFTAFAKMSLNEGDVLSTGNGSSAVLQFANGTSEDDKMTVSASTTLTFSKLSTNNGTTTKVSMFNGSAWVDVKSIKNKDDEFTLETPTAVMGVRGTHLLVSVDPNTGATRLTVVAGVVKTETKDETKTDTQDVYPNENAYIGEDGQGEQDILIAAVDLELLIGQSSSDIVQAIVQAAGEIQKENEQKIDQYLEKQPSESQVDLDRLKSNIENLIGAVISQALESQKISKDKVDELLKEVQTQTGAKIDLKKKQIVLSDKEKQLQQEKLKKEQEAIQLANELKKKELEARQQELKEKLEKDRQKKQEEIKKELEKKQKKAKEDYEKQLKQEERERYEKDKKQREEELLARNEPIPTPTPTPPVSTPTPTPPPGDAKLHGLSGEYMWGDGSNGSNPYQSFEIANFSPDLHEYEMQVSSNAFMLYLHLDVNGAAEVSIRNRADGEEETQSFYPNEGRYFGLLSPGLNYITISISLDDWETEESYTLTVTRGETPVGITSWLTTYADGESEQDVPIPWTWVGKDAYAASVEDSIEEMKIEDVAFAGEGYSMHTTQLAFGGTPITETYENGSLTIHNLDRGYNFILFTIENADHDIVSETTLIFYNGGLPDGLEYWEASGSSNFIEYDPFEYGNKIFVNLTDGTPETENYLKVKLAGNYDARIVKADDPDFVIQFMQDEGVFKAVFPDLHYGINSEYKLEIIPPYGPSSFYDLYVIVGDELGNLQVNGETAEITETGYVYTTHIAENTLTFGTAPEFVSRVTLNGQTVPYENGFHLNNLMNDQDNIVVIEMWNYHSVEGYPTHTLRLIYRPSA